MTDVHTLPLHLFSGAVPVVGLSWRRNPGALAIPPGKGKDYINVHILSSDEDASARTMAQGYLKLVSFITFASWRCNYGHYE